MFILNVQWSYDYTTINVILFFEIYILIQIFEISSTVSYIKQLANLVYYIRKTFIVEIRREFILNIYFSDRIDVKQMFLKILLPSMLCKIIFYCQNALYQTSFYTRLYNNTYWAQQCKIITIKMVWRITYYTNNWIFPRDLMF